MKVYVWPDGTVRSEPALDMSDDYIVIDSDDKISEVVMTIMDHFGDDQSKVVFQEIAECILSE